MARTTVYNAIVSDELYEKVNEENKDLLNEFVEYLQSTDKSKLTIKSYVSDIKICFVWSLQYNKNKFFVDFTKRDIMRYQNYLINTLNLSPNRIRRLKGSISSMSNYIESMLDDVYPNFRPIVNKIPAPVKQPVREKTVLSDEQVQELFDYLIENKQYQKACVFALGVGSGARKSELLRFKVSYFKDEYIKYGALYKTPEKIVTKGRGSNGKPLYKYTFVNVFKPYFDLWMEERNKLGINCDELFVVKKDGVWEPIKVSTLNSWAEGFSKILGIDFYFHSLRHHWTSSLRKSNLPDKVIQELQGWTNSVMIDIYDDTEVDDELGKYFDENGIKKIEKKSLEDL